MIAFNFGDPHRPYRPPSFSAGYVRAHLRGTRHDSVETRFWMKVEKTDTCWIWIAGYWRSGYGQFMVGRKPTAAHRLAYEWLVGPIPQGLDLDHLCRVRRCVNPAHLEPVSRRVNLLRGDTGPAHNVTKTHCPHGHEYTPENTRQFKNSRKCITCARANDRKRRKDAVSLAIRRAKWQAKAKAEGRRPRHGTESECVHGHPFDAENTYRAPNGQRVCKACRRLIDRKRQTNRSQVQHLSPGTKK